jgi:hypothetical protein
MAIPFLRSTFTTDFYATRDHRTRAQRLDVLKATIPRHHRDTTATAFGDLYGGGDNVIMRLSA